MLCSRTELPPFSRPPPPESPLSPTLSKPPLTLTSTTIFRWPPPPCSSFSKSAAALDISLRSNASIPVFPLSWGGSSSKLPPNAEKSAAAPVPPPVTPAVGSSHKSSGSLASRLSSSLRPSPRSESGARPRLLGRTSPSGRATPRCHLPPPNPPLEEPRSPTGPRSPMEPRSTYPPPEEPRSAIEPRSPNPPPPPPNRSVGVPLNRSVGVPLPRAPMDPRGRSPSSPESKSRIRPAEECPPPLGRPSLRSAGRRSRAAAAHISSASKVSQHTGSCATLETTTLPSNSNSLIHSGGPSSPLPLRLSIFSLVYRITFAPPPSPLSPPTTPPMLPMAPPPWPNGASPLPLLFLEIPALELRGCPRGSTPCPCPPWCPRGSPP
mmetsp:Transcript_22512/g.40582  ORF Transcript_22512/g.40582 Transcript_22512/m.40582 type:complete len:379 (-) Transcript_22512:487-1623(-)